MRYCRFRFWAGEWPVGAVEQAQRHDAADGKRMETIDEEVTERALMSQRCHGTNPLTRERAAREAEFVAATEDAVEIG